MTYSNKWPLQTEPARLKFCAPKVTALFDVGTEQDLFEFYPEEISFQGN